MELKVFKDTLAAYGGRWETRQELPVETEILIPDYQPAVFKIVKCLMQPVVLQNRVASGRWHCEGYLRCTVYYQSDEPGCRLYRTEQKFAFEKSVELPDAAFAEGPAQVWGEQEYCNCRAVSEHRIDLRGAYILCAAALMVRNCELLTSLADCGIEQRTQELSGLTRVAAEEKALTSEINLPLPGTGESILDIGGSFTLTSLTMQTGQASCQGILQVQVCCQPPESEALDVRTKEMTVQQTVDLPRATSASPGANCCTVPCAQRMVRRMQAYQLHGNCTWNCGGSLPTPWWRTHTRPFARHRPCRPSASCCKGPPT